MRVKGAANWQDLLQLFKGRYQTYGHPKYGLVVTAWPRKRGPHKTPAATANSQVFALAVSLCKRPMAIEVETAEAVTRGTGYLPRDLLESAAYGLLMVAIKKDGTIIYGGRMVSQDAQALLDSITQDVGALIVRTAEGWVALDAGATPGYVLTSVGTGLVPAWEAPTGGGGGGQTITWTSNTIGTFAGIFYRAANPIGLLTGSCFRLRGLLKRAGTTSGCVGIINAAGTSGYYVAAQHDGNLVSYRLNSTSATALKASGSATTSGNLGYCCVDIWLSVDKADGNNIAGAFHGYGLPPVSDTTYDLTSGTWYLAAMSTNLANCGTASLASEPS